MCIKLGNSKTNKKDLRISLAYSLCQPLLDMPVAGNRGLHIQALAGLWLICRGSRESILLVVRRREGREEDAKFVEVRRQMRERKRTQNCKQVHAV